MRTNYDASYHFRHMPHSQTNTVTRSKDASTPGNNSNGNVAQSNGYPPPLPPPHVSYEDHLEKAARLAEMSSYSGQVIKAFLSLFLLKLCITPSSTLEWSGSNVWLLLERAQFI